MTDEETGFEVTLRPALAKEQSLITRLVLENNLNPFGLDWQSFTVAADKDNRFIGCGQIKKHGNAEHQQAATSTGWQAVACTEATEAAEAARSGIAAVLEHGRSGRVI